MSPIVIIVILMIHIIFLPYRNKISIEQKKALEFEFHQSFVVPCQCLSSLKIKHVDVASCEITQPSRMVHSFLGIFVSNPSRNETFL